MSGVMDYRIRVRVYNNQLVRRREELGMAQGEFARAAGVPPASYCALETMRESPLKSDGGWRDMAAKIAAFHAIELTELFPPESLAGGVRVGEREINGLELQALASGTPQYALPADAEYDGNELQRVVAEVLEDLTPREADVIRRRFGFSDGGGGQSLRDIGDDQDVTWERIRQIEQKALRKLRHPSMARLLKPFVPGGAP